MILALPAVALVALTLLPGAPARAQGAADAVTLSVVPGWRTDSGSHMAGLRIALAPGWKTYWRVPGEAGIPPQFSFEGSRNLAAARLHWPRPEVFTTYGVDTVGYADEVILPLELTPAEPGAPISVSVHAAIGVCEDICLPVEVLFRAELPPGEGALVPAISEALARIPRAAVGTVQVRCAIEPIGDGLRLTAQLAVPDQGAQEWVFLEPARADIWVSQAEVTRSGSTLTAVSELVPPEAAPFALDRTGLRFTVLGARGAVDILGCQAD